MMEVMLPPFERFYEEHREEILGYLRGLLPREAAEDAWQETFLRALRAYSGLQKLMSPDAHTNTVFCPGGILFSRSGCSWGV